MLVVFSYATVLAKPLTLIYSGNLDGELEPCGCTMEGDFGGIRRRASVLDQLRDQRLEPVLISSGGLISGVRVIDRIKSEYILKGFADLHYDAIGMQWQDFSYGMEFAIQYDLPWVLGNGTHKGIATVKPISRKTDDGLVELRIYSWLDPEDAPTPQTHAERPLVQVEAQSLLKDIRRSEKQGKLTLLSTSSPLATVQKRFDLTAIDIVIVRSSYERFAEPHQIDQTLVLQPGSRGKYLGRLDLETGPKGNIAQWQHTLIPLSRNVPDAPRLEAWYDEYNERLEEDYQKRVEIRKLHESGAQGFSGEASCKVCHPVQHQVWLKSEHAGAYERLESVKKAYDPHCIECHTVGFNASGGFLDKLVTPHLVGVQCESCHGQAKAHVRSAGRQPVRNRLWTKERMCSQCHVKNHSPSFSMDTYWPKIAH